MYNYAILKLSIYQIFYVLKIKFLLQNTSSSERVKISMTASMIDYGFFDKFKQANIENFM